jgi:hypothetical protein
VSLFVSFFVQNLPNFAKLCLTADSQREKFSFFSVASCSKFEPSFESASDAFPAFWRENATDATETKKRRISSAIVERSERF